MPAAALRATSLSSLSGPLAQRKDSPNTKYRSRSALLQERASKLVSGGGELTARVEPRADLMRVTLRQPSCGGKPANGFSAGSRPA
jgi:hypothetical protein